MSLNSCSGSGSARLTVGVEQFYQILEKLVNSPADSALGQTKTQEIFAQLRQEGYVFENDQAPQLDRLIYNFIQYGVKNHLVKSSDILLIQDIAKHTFQGVKKELNELSLALVKEFTKKDPKKESPDKEMTSEQEKEEAHAETREEGQFNKKDEGTRKQSSSASPSFKSLLHSDHLQALVGPDAYEEILEIIDRNYNTLPSEKPILLDKLVFALNNILFIKKEVNNESLTFRNSEINNENLSHIISLAIPFLKNATHDQSVDVLRSLVKIVINHEDLNLDSFVTAVSEHVKDITESLRILNQMPNVLNGIRNSEERAQFCQLFSLLLTKGEAFGSPVRLLEMLVSTLENHTFFFINNGYQNWIKIPPQQRTAILMQINPYFNDIFEAQLIAMEIAVQIPSLLEGNRLSQFLAKLEDTPVNERLREAEQLISSVLQGGDINQQLTNETVTLFELRKIFENKDDIHYSMGLLLGNLDVANPSLSLNELAISKSFWYRYLDGLTALLKIIPSDDKIAVMKYIVPTLRQMPVEERIKLLHEYKEMIKPTKSNARAVSFQKRLSTQLNQEQQLDVEQLIRLNEFITQFSFDFQIVVLKILFTKLDQDYKFSYVNGQELQNRLARWSHPAFMSKIKSFKLLESLLTPGYQELLGVIQTHLHNEKIPFFIDELLHYLQITPDPYQLETLSSAVEHIFIKHIQSQRIEVVEHSVNSPGSSPGETNSFSNRYLKSINSNPEKMKIWQEHSEEVLKVIAGIPKELYDPNNADEINMQLLDLILSLYARFSPQICSDMTKMMIDFWVDPEFKIDRNKLKILEIVSLESLEAGKTFLAKLRESLDDFEDYERIKMIQFVGDVSSLGHKLSNKVSNQFFLKALLSLDRKLKDISTMEIYVNKWLSSPSVIQVLLKNLHSESDPVRFLTTTLILPKANLKSWLSFFNQTKETESSKAQALKKLFEYLGDGTRMTRFLATCERDELLKKIDWALKLYEGLNNAKFEETFSIICRSINKERSSRISTMVPLIENVLEINTRLDLIRELFLLDDEKFETLSLFPYLVGSTDVIGSFPANRLLKIIEESLQTLKKIDPKIKPYFLKFIAKLHESIKDEEQANFLVSFFCSKLNPAPPSIQPTLMLLNRYLDSEVAYGYLFSVIQKIHPQQTGKFFENLSKFISTYASNDKKLNIPLFNFYLHLNTIVSSPNQRDIVLHFFDQFSAEEKKNTLQYIGDRELFVQSEQEFLLLFDLIRVIYRELKEKAEDYLRTNHEFLFDPSKMRTFFSEMKNQPIVESLNVLNGLIAADRIEQCVSTLRPYFEKGTEGLEVILQCIEPSNIENNAFMSPFLSGLTLLPQSQRYEAAMQLALIFNGLQTKEQRERVLDTINGFDLKNRSEVIQSLSDFCEKEVDISKKMKFIDTLKGLSIFPQFKPLLDRLTKNKSSPVAVPAQLNPTSTPAGSSELSLKDQIRKALDPFPKDQRSHLESFIERDLKDVNPLVIMGIIELMVKMPRETIDQALRIFQKIDGIPSHKKAILIKTILTSFNKPEYQNPVIYSNKLSILESAFKSGVGPIRIVYGLKHWEALPPHVQHRTSQAMEDLLGQQNIMTALYYLVYPTDSEIEWNAYLEELTAVLLATDFKYLYTLVNTFQFTSGELRSIILSKINQKPEGIERNAYFEKLYAHLSQKQEAFTSPILKNAYIKAQLQSFRE